TVLSRLCIFLPSSSQQILSLSELVSRGELLSLSHHQELHVCCRTRRTSFRALGTEYPLRAGALRNPSPSNQPASNPGLTDSVSSLEGYSRLWGRGERWNGSSILQNPLGAC